MRRVASFFSWIKKTVNGFVELPVRIRRNASKSRARSSRRGFKFKRFVRYGERLEARIALDGSMPFVPQLVNSTNERRSLFAETNTNAEAIGWEFPDNLDAADYRTGNQFEGVIRYPGGVTPVLYVTQSDHNDPTNDGLIHVVTMGSRDRDGERLRSNLQKIGSDTKDTAPPPTDHVVRSISLNGSSIVIDGQPIRSYNRPRGMAIVDNVLFVGVDQPIGPGTNDGMILLFDLGVNGELATDPQPIQSFTVGHEINNLSVARHQRETLIWTSSNDGRSAQVYRTATTTDLRDDRLSLELFDQWNAGRSLDYQGPTWPAGVDAHQSVTFVRTSDRADGLYMIAMRHPGGEADRGDDFADVYEVEVSTGSFSRLSLEHRHTIQLKCAHGDDDRRCNFAAGSSAYASPTGELILYSVPHHRIVADGPDYVRMAEFRHENVIHRASSAFDVVADAGGDYGAEEGADVQLSASGRGVTATAWLELFEHADPAFQVNDLGRSILIDFADRNSYELNDLNELDGFNDIVSSLRYYSNGMSIQLFEHDNFQGQMIDESDWAGYSFDLNANGIGFGDRISSVRFVGNPLPAGPLTYRWDLDGDGVFGETGTDAANGDEMGQSPTLRTDRLTAGYHFVRVEVCDPSDRCDQDSAAVLITDPPIEMEISTDNGFDNPVHTGVESSIRGVYVNEGRSNRHRVQIDWGDDSPLVQVNVSANEDGGEFSATHSYPIPGAYRVTVTLLDQPEGARAEVEATATTVIVVSSPTIASTGNAAIDLSFGQGGIGQAPIQETRGQFTVLPDGSFIVAGLKSEFIDDTPISYMAATKFRADGSVDSTFGDAGTAIVAFGGGMENSHANDVVVLPSGDVVLVGAVAVQRTSGVVRGIGLAKLDSNGQLLKSTEFELNDFGFATTAIVDSSGGIVVASATTGDLLRYTPQLLLDSTFGENGVATSSLQAESIYVTDLEESADGYIVYGRASVLRSTDEFFLSAFRADGSIDLSFGSQGIRTFGGPDPRQGTAGGISIQPNGRIVASAADAAGAGPIMAARFLADGALDTSFGTDGITLIPLRDTHEYYPGDVAIQDDGSILIAGGDSVEFMYQYDLMITRLTPAGGLDTSFGSGGSLRLERLGAGADIVIVSLTEILVSDVLGAYQTRVARIAHGRQSSISGRKWHDKNNNFQYDAGEEVAGAHIYVDSNHNGAHEFNEPFTTTGVDGTYELTGIGWGQHAIRSTSAIRHGGDHSSFGFALDLQGEKLAVGAPQAKRAGRNVGQAYVYHLGLAQRSVLDPGQLSSPLDPTDAFGASIALRSDEVFVGAPAVGNGVVVGFELDGVQASRYGRTQFAPRAYSRDNHGGAFHYGWNFAQFNSQVVSANGVFGSSANHYGEADITNGNYPCEIVSASSVWLPGVGSFDVAGCLPSKIGNSQGGVLWRDPLAGSGGLKLLASPQPHSAYGDTVKSFRKDLFVSDPLFTGVASEVPHGHQGMVQIHKTSEISSPDLGSARIVRINNPGIRGRFGISFDYDGEYLYIGNGFDSVAVYHWDRVRDDAVTLLEVIKRPPGPDAKGLSFGFTVDTDKSSPYVAVAAVGGILSDPGEVFLIPKARYVNLAEGGISNVDFIQFNGQTSPFDPSSATALNPLTGTQVSLQAEGSVEISNIQFAPAPTEDIPTGVRFPLGQMSFHLNDVPVGEQVRVAIDVHDTTLTKADFAGYYKQHPSEGWYELAAVEVDEYPTSSLLRITLTLRDGGEFEGDRDLIANGIIVDPGAIAVRDFTTDLNDDGKSDGRDIDHLCQVIHDQSRPVAFDFDSDEVLNLEDQVFFTRQWMQIPIGDVNADGTVDFSDFLVISANFGRGAAAWSHGDFDCDGKVGFSDFLRLSSNFGRTTQHKET